MWKKGCKSVVIITTGDPAGIGPEIILKTLKNEQLQEKARFVVIGDEAVYKTYDVLKINRIKSLDDYKEGVLNLIPVSNIKNIKHGRPTKETAISAYNSLEKAVNLIKNGLSNAIVTAPLYKKGIVSAGIKFIGHTEFFMEKFNVDDVLMSFYSKKLFVGTVTTHVPLSFASKMINKNVLTNKIMIVLAFFRKFFNKKNPVIAVLGLNPHSGEGGCLGNEEIKVISPVCDSFRKKKEKIIGPISADVAFFQAFKGMYDFVLGMYHDQVLAPFKMLYFDEGVNITMGLPFIRTSPDHGTAFDIAGKGKADEKSMLQAVKLALKMLNRLKG
jgi:4-hydroxythreonine-4-phosphate dehydrogenase